VNGFDVLEFIPRDCFVDVYYVLEKTRSGFTCTDVNNMNRKLNKLSHYGFLDVTVYPVVVKCFVTRSGKKFFYETTHRKRFYRRLK
jgi:hypothetical protein